jgi:hypothetical protein
MQYPDKMQIGGNTINVEVLNEPIRKVDDLTYVIGEYHPIARTMKCYHSEAHKDTCGESFVHETVEAIDSLYDLGLPHQTITTLATALYQAYSSGSVSFQ